MKALSILQPWAWYVVRGIKPIENRTWPCLHRGPLLIHAGKGYDTTVPASFFEEITGAPHPPKEFFDNLRGGIVGRVNMLDVINCREIKAGNRHLYHSPWFFGPYGFIFSEAKPLTFRPCRGERGIFQVDYEQRIIEGETA